MANYRNEYLYQVRVYDATNAVVAIYDDLTSVQYKKQVNRVGLAVLTIPEGHDLINYAVDDTLIEIWIGYPKLTPTAGWALTWVQDFMGLFRDRQIATDNDGNVYHLLYGPGALEIISRYVSAYPAGSVYMPGSVGQSVWTASELATIVNDVVRWNCTAEATVANGRIRTANVIRGLDDAGSIPGTPVVSYAIPPGRNILEFVQELAPICGFDFDVVRNPGIKFQQYAGQLGTDNSASVFFDLSLDNCSGTNLDFDGLREKTTAIVGGQGEGLARYFVVRTGANYAATNDYEVFVDARDKEDLLLDDFGDARLGELESRLQLRTTVQTSRGWVYRREYGHGDLVTVSFAGFTEVKKISTTEVRFDQDQRTEIRLEFTEP
jgi:hypothetical protein